MGLTSYADRIISKDCDTKFLGIDVDSTLCWKHHGEKITHTNTYTHMNTYTYIDTNTNTYTHINTYTYIDTNTYIQTYIHISIHTCQDGGGSGGRDRECVKCGGQHGGTKQ